MHSTRLWIGRWTLTMGSLFLVWFGLPSWAGAGEPDIQFEVKAYDFGRLMEGEKTEYSYRFRNAGGEPLIIGDIRTSCGCTAALVSAKRVAPGEEGEIRVTFDSSGRPGKTHKTITVWSNDPDTPKVTLTLSGIVWSEVEITPRRIGFGYVDRATLESTSGKEEKREGLRTWKEVHVKFPTDPKLHVTRVVATSNALEVEVMPRDAEDSGEDVVRIGITPEAPIGPLTEEVTIFTTSKVKPTVSVWVRANVRGDLVVTPRSLALRVSKKDTSYVRQVFVWKKGKKDLRVVAVEDRTGIFTANVVELKSGEKYRIDLTLKSDAKAGPIKGKVIVRTNYPEQPEVEISVYGRIEE